MKKVALILAAGDGSRMNMKTPKQFLLLNQKPVLYHTLKCFTNTYPDIDFILVLPQEHMDHGQEIVDGFFDRSKFKLCIGGRTRFDSVQNGLKLVDEECIIFVHDGVRCLVSPDLIQRCYDTALEAGTAVPVIPCNENIRIEKDGSSVALEQSAVMVQSPQAFHSKILLPAYSIDYKERFTDEATVVEAYGLQLHLIEGEELNIKISTPIDFFIAEKIKTFTQQ